MQGLTIRLEREEERRAVEELTRDAFWDVHAPGCTEHYILYNLRKSGDFIPELDFVAEYQGELAGHIAFTRARVTDSQGNAHLVISFGPVSVKPGQQGKGVGSALIIHALRRAKRLGYPAVCIYGDPRYYSRFGFACAECYGIQTDDGKYATALQALELQPEALKGISGRFCESEAFELEEEKFLEYEKGFPVKAKGSRGSQRDFQVLSSLRYTRGSFLQTPVLETERLILRPLRVSDAQEIFQGWTSDPQVTRFMNYYRHQSVEDTVEWLRLEEENQVRDDNYTWVFVKKDSGELLGSGGIMLREENGDYEIGYNIRRKYWDQGYTTEASKKILEFAAEELGATRFFGRHAKDNPASGKVMEKLGFVYVRDSTYSTNDGARTFASKEYELNI